MNKEDLSDVFDIVFGNLLSKSDISILDRISDHLTDDQISRITTARSLFLDNKIKSGDFGQTLSTIKGEVLQNK